MSSLKWPLRLLLLLPNSKFCQFLFSHIYKTVHRSHLNDMKQPLQQQYSNNFRLKQWYGYRTIVMILIYIHFPWFVISFKSFEDVLMATCILLCQKFIAFFFYSVLVSAYEEIEKTSLIQIYGCYSRCVDNNDTSAYKSPKSIWTFIYFFVLCQYDDAILLRHFIFVSIRNHEDVKSFIVVYLHDNSFGCCELDEAKNIPNYEIKARIILKQLPIKPHAIEILTVNEMAFGDRKKKNTSVTGCDFFSSKNKLYVWQTFKQINFSVGCIRLK